MTRLFLIAFYLLVPIGADVGSHHYVPDPTPVGSPLAWSLGNYVPPPTPEMIRYRHWKEELDEIEGFFRHCSWLAFGLATVAFAVFVARTAGAAIRHILGRIVRRWRGMGSDPIRLI